MSILVMKLEHYVSAIDQALVPYAAETEADKTDYLQAAVDLSFAGIIENLDNLLAEGDTPPTGLQTLLAVRLHLQTAVGLSFVTSSASESDSVDLRRFRGMYMKKVEDITLAINECLKDRSVVT